MINRRKVVFVIVALALSVFVLLLATILIAPQLVDTPTVKAKVRSEFKTVTGAEVDFEHLVLDFLPRPHIIFKQVTLSVPPAAKGQAVSLKVRPKILPLFAGEVQIAGIELESAELDYILSQKPVTEKTAPKAFSYYDLTKRIQMVVAGLPEFKIPDLDFQVNNSRANLFFGGRKLLELTAVSSHLAGPPAGRKIEISCKSNRWQHISISGRLNTKTFKGSGQIQLTQFRPEGLLADLLPDTPIRITDAPADLTLDFKTDEPGHLQAELNGAGSHLKFHLADEALSIRNPRIKAAIQIDKKAVRLSLTELALDEPRLSLSANMALTQSTPPLSLEVNDKQIDVAATRQMVLALAGNNEDVNDIFDIVRGGRVPWIILTARGNSLGELGNTDNMVIRGQMRNGEISIPDIQLDLKDTAGEVDITRGILQGQNLQARLGNSMAQNGKLKLGLIGDVAPFHLETDVQADLSQLPPILKRLVDDRDFQKELALLKELTGSARGRLILGEDTDNVKVDVAASHIRLNASYERLPYALQITEGNFSYNEHQIGVEQLSGKLGKSSFSQFSGELGLENNRDLEIRSGQSILHLTEIVPWLASFEKMHDITGYYGGGQSIIALSQVKMNGPLFNPSKWKFSVSGDAKDLVLKNLPKRPGPLKIASAKFNADPHTLEFTDANMSMLDSVWKLTAVHKDYFNGFDKDARWTFECRLGSKSVQWFSELLKVPQHIQIRPLTLSTSNLSYARNGEKTLSASLVLKDGPKIETDIVLSSDKLVAKKLVIQDKASRATMGISLHEKILQFSFKGHLHRSTLDRFWAKNPWLAGWLEGDINAHINLRHPLKSTARGNLKGREIFFPWKPDAPLEINGFAVAAAAHEINLQSADVTFRGNHLHTAGKIKRSGRNVLLDMDISADSLDLDPLIQALKDSGENESGEDKAKLMNIAVQGNIRFEAGRFNLGRFNWNPLHADISLHDNTADVILKKAVLCGISTPGRLRVSPSIVEFDLQAVAEDQKLNPAQTCMVGGDFRADGTYNLKGRFKGRGKPEDMLKAATGQVVFTAQDGHIYRDAILKESIKYLNTREPKRDRVDLAHMRQEGFGYHSFQVKAELQDGKLRYDEAVLHGRTMTVTAAGEHDLQNGRFDLILLVAPLVTLNRIFEHIPLIGGILEALDTIPLSAKGTLDDIQIYPLAPSAIGYELKEMMKKTVGRPIKLDGNEKSKD